MTSGSTVQLNVIFTILVVGFSLVWLLAERIANRNRFVTFLLATLIYFVFLGVNLLSNGFSEDIIAIVSLAAISISAIILAFTIAILISTKSFDKTRFLIYLGAALFCSLLIIFSVIMFIFFASLNISVNTRIKEVLTASFFSNLIYFVGLLPFLALLFANPFWLKRFEAVSGIQTNIDLQPPPQ